MTTTLAPVRELPFLDLHGTFARDPIEAIDALRGEHDGPLRLARSQRGIEVFAYDLYAQCLKYQYEVMRNQTGEEKAAEGAGQILADFLSMGHILHMPEEPHLRIRKILMGAFTASNIESQKDLFAGIAHDLIDDFAAAGRCDLVDDFTHKFAIRVLCMMIGVSTDHIPIFERATIDIALMKADPLEPGLPRLREALQELKDYGTALVDGELETPKGGFVDALHDVAETGGLTREEQIWQIAGLLFTGHDTTRYALAAVAQSLLEEGAWTEVAAEPGLIPQAVQEGLRWSPTAMVVTRKVVSDDVVLDGVPIPRDTMLRFNQWAIHRDPERFDRPNEFNVHRPVDNLVFPFGAGRHKCIGFKLARTDIETALGVLMQRLSSPRIDGEVVHSPYTWALGGPSHVPVAFDGAERRQDAGSGPR